MSNRENLTPETMQLNEVAPEGFCNEPRSLFYEVTKLRQAVMKMCDVMQQLDHKIETQSDLLGDLGKIVGNVIAVLPLKTDKHITDGGETPDKVV